MRQGLNTNLLLISITVPIIRQIIYNCCRRCKSAKPHKSIRILYTDIMLNINILIISLKISIVKCFLKSPYALIKNGYLSTFTKASTVFIEIQTSAQGAAKNFANECKKTKQKVIKKSANPKQDLPIFGTSQGIRTPVTAVRGRCPRPLDQGGIWLRNKDSNLNNTSQSRRCYRYTIPHRFNAVYYNKSLFICQAKILFPRCRFSPKN